MMMLEDPYRWAEAVANRRDYIENQLRIGSPVVGIGYQDGALLLTLGQGQQKLFEVYDRIAMASIGHSADIEKLRQAGIDMAHQIGFNYSDADVTLQQIVHFGLGPTVKTAFDEYIRSPYLVRILLAELSGIDDKKTFYTVDYDGAFYKTEGWCVLGGIPEADRAMRKYQEELYETSLSLEAALKWALQVWVVGQFVGKLEEIPQEALEFEKLIKNADLDGFLKSEFETLKVEAVVLQHSIPGKNKYRTLEKEEIEPAIENIWG